MKRKSNSNSQIVLYQTADGKVTVSVLFARDNFWLTQRAMTELFGVNTPAVSRHLKNIFESGELAEESVVSILETTAADGKNYPTRFYKGWPATPLRWQQQDFPTPCRVFGIALPGGRPGRYI